MKRRAVASTIVASSLGVAIEIGCSGPKSSNGPPGDVAPSTDAASTTGDASPAGEGSDGSPTLLIPEGGVSPQDGRTSPQDAGRASPQDAGQPPPFMDPFGGASGCDGGIDASSPPRISMVMPVQGPLTTVLGWPSTPGGGSGGRLLVWQEVLPDSTRVDVTLQMNQALPPGLVGPQPPTSLEIRWYDQPDGGYVGWLGPSGVCSITFASNVCDPSYLPSPGRMEYFVSGTGSCSQAIAPEPGNPNGPLTVGDFYFVTDFVALTGDQ